MKTQGRTTFASIQNTYAGMLSDYFHTNLSPRILKSTGGNCSAGDPADFFNEVSQKSPFAPKSPNGDFSKLLIFSVLPFGLGVKTLKSAFWELFRPIALIQFSIVPVYAN